MEKLKEQIHKSRNIKNNSLNTYLCALKKIKKTIDNEGKGEYEDFKFLYDFDKVMDAINKEKKITSKKNKLTAILVALNSEESKKEDLIDKYGNELKQLSEKYLTFLKEQKRTDTQLKNWLDYDDLIRVINKKMNDVKNREIHKNKGDKPLSNKDFDLLQEYLILLTYINFPLRNDFADLKILTKKQLKGITKEEQEKHNYLVLLPKNKKKFYINVFKNKKYIGAKILDVPSKLNKVINLWLRFNKSGWYLVKTDRKTPMTPNGITKFLNKIFVKSNNKKISTGMIRHIVISNMLKNEKTLKEKEKEKNEIENKFFHSQKINDLYRKII